MTSLYIDSADIQQIPIPIFSKYLMVLFIFRVFCVLLY